MAEVILIYGKSGSGKSRSLINFGEKEIALIKCEAKRLPMQKDFKYQMVSTDINEIMPTLKNMPCKVAVIDDFTYLMTKMFMEGHRSGDQFKLYNNIADTVYCFIEWCKQGLPEDVIVYLIMHEDPVPETGDIKLRTIGKLLDQKVSIEGMVTVALRCIVKAGQHIFVTQSDGSDVSKSPEGMFELEIPNDLKAVDIRVREYWGIREEKKKDA